MKLKKILTLLLILIIAFTSIQISFAKDEIKTFTQEVNGKIATTTILTDNSNEKIVVVEYGTSKVYSRLDKITNRMTIYKDTSELKSLTDIESMEIVMEVDLNEASPPEQPRSNTTSYHSTCFPNYQFNGEGAYGMIKFKLVIPINRSLETGYVGSNTTEWSRSYSFKEEVINADNRFLEAISTGFSYYPPYFVVNSLKEIVIRLSDGHISSDDFTAFMIIIFTGAGIPGNVYNTAILVSQLSLSGTHLHNARTHFHRLEDIL